MRKWLKNIRKELDLTQADVAKKAEISQNYYSTIELGERGKKLPTETAQKIAAALGFDWQRFYEAQ